MLGVEEKNMNPLYLDDVKKVAMLALPWKKIDGKSLLISGGNGFIGSFLIDVFRYRNNVFNSKIRVYSISRRGGESDDTVMHYICDITKFSNFHERVDYIIHLASNTHPKQYKEDPVGTITTNIIGCDNLLKIAKEQKVERFLLASSVEIYGQGTDSLMDENYCGYLNCNSFRSGYNEAKRTCETLCQSYLYQYGVNCVIARFARVIGPDKKDDTKAMSQFLNCALAKNDIVLKSRGTQRYSFVYIADAVSGLLTILLNGLLGEVYNVSDDDEGYTLGQYAKLISEFSNTNVIFDIEENDSVSKATYALISNKKLKALGWKPRYTISDGLSRTYKIKCESI